MRRKASISIVLLGLACLAVPAAADELNPREAESMREPGLQPYVAAPRPGTGDPGMIQRAESYRSSLLGSIQQLERSGSTDRDVQDRLRDLRNELSRVENSLTDAKRLGGR
jgi:hypothetical protein